MSPTLWCALTTAQPCPQWTHGRVSDRFRLKRLRFPSSQAPHVATNFARSWAQRATAAGKNFRRSLPPCSTATSTSRVASSTEADAALLSGAVETDVSTADGSPALVLVHAHPDRSHCRLGAECTRRSPKARLYAFDGIALPGDLTWQRPPAAQSADSCAATDKKRTAALPRRHAERNTRRRSRAQCRQRPTLCVTGGDAGFCTSSTPHPSPPRATAAALASQRTQRRQCRRAIAARGCSVAGMCACVAMPSSRVADFPIDQQVHA